MISSRVCRALQWLEAQQEYPHFFWTSRNHDHVFAGAGIDDNNQSRAFVGCRRFDSGARVGGEWKPFGIRSQFSPKRVFAAQSEPVNEFPVIDGLSSLLGPIAVENSPTQSEFVNLVNRALNAIRAGDAEKIVLAVRRSFTFADPIQMTTLLFALKACMPNTFVFGLSPAPGVAFVGASPELLFSRRKNQLTTEAQAGTRIRGASFEEDQRLSDELISSVKDLHEHQVVREDVERCLSRLCHDYDVMLDTHVVQLPNVQHLRTTYLGQLKSGADDDRVTDVLHPTAAVQGSPRLETRQWLRANEPFDRGLYAGPVGVWTPEFSETAVAIRSALVEGNRLHVYGGAGIVVGSDAEAEWTEVENKMQAMTRLWH